ncbi:BnaA03g60420D [Brassica napus]|uniref:BnaA03g60420D protein n=1 Tax=Brassica napus TaxID=3708 RepID=A0A078H5E9_BRANA|nr:BnaA03g60420D [Brassica napus]
MLSNPPSTPLISTTLLTTTSLLSTLLLNTVQIMGLTYDPISPDPSPSHPLTFDSSIAHASPSSRHLLFSPQPFTPLTSPTKSNDTFPVLVFTQPQSMLSQLPLRPTPHMADQVLLLLTRYSTQLASEYAAFAPPFLPSYSQETWGKFGKSFKKAIFA